MMLITYNGLRLPVSEWAARAKVSTSVLRGRIAKFGEVEAVARSLAKPGVWPRNRRQPVRRFVRCRAEGCTRAAYVQHLCFKHFCAELRASEAAR